jgi:hypothetical protein
MDPSIFVPIVSPCYTETRGEHFGISVVSSLRTIDLTKKRKRRDRGKLTCSFPGKLNSKSASINVLESLCKNAMSLFWWLLK